MKTRLLRKLRREACEAFKFTIVVENRFGVWAEVFSYRERAYFTVDGKKGAERFCRLAINMYIQDRINELRLK